MHAFISEAAEFYSHQSSEYSLSTTAALLHNFQSPAISDNSRTPAALREQDHIMMHKIVFYGPTAKK